VKYRNKLFDVDAVVWDGKSGTIFPFAPFENVIEPPCIEEDGALVITTYDIVMRAEIGDWVIRSLSGNIYTCKSEDFEKKYEVI